MFEEYNNNTFVEEAWIDIHRENGIGEWNSVFTNLMLLGKKGV